MSDTVLQSSHEAQYVREHEAARQAALLREACQADQRNYGRQIANQPEPSYGGNGLPRMQLVDYRPAAPTESSPGWLESNAYLALNTGVAIAEGAYGAGAATAQAVGHAAVSLWNNPGQIGDAAVYAYDGVANAVTHPQETLGATGQAIGNSADWVYDHPLQTAGMVAAGAFAFFSGGTGSPLSVALTTGMAAGGAATVHAGFDLTHQLNTHEAEFAVLADPSHHSQAEVDAARQTIAGATGSDVLQLGAGVLGVGAGRALGALGRASGGAEDLAGTTTRTGLDAPPPPATPPVTEVPNPTPTPNPNPTPNPSNPNPTTGSPGASTPRRAPDAHRDASDAPAKPDEAGTDRGASPVALDHSGRPLSEGNEARVAAEHPPISPEDLKIQREALARDLDSYRGGDGRSIAQNFAASNLSPAQQERLLNVMAEVRATTLQSGATEQVNNFRHMIGELNEGLESARGRNLSPTETQDALLAGLLSDAHKYGFSRLNGGNFFSHHLDGALAARTILSRQIGEGLGQQDIDAISHAILEHQIGPPGFMSQAYAAEINRGMRAAGVTPSAEDTARIEHIRQLMADPLNVATESDPIGGQRVRFTPEERDLLERYVGSGTGSWHVPSAANSWDSVSRTMIAADSFDNYFPRVDATGVISAPFKIAALRGPLGNPSDASLAIAERALYENEESALGLLSGADRDRALTRMGQSDAVFAQARTRTAEWYTREYGHPPDANTPYWGRPIPARPDGSDAAALQAWKDNPDVQQAIAIANHYAETMHEMRLR